MQFDRDASGKLNPLPKPSIDTGMGLERVASVLQGVISNYDTDLFTPLIKRAAELTGTSLKKELDKEAHTKSAASLRVIADHSRAATFLISDGVLPSNEGRGYVLRKIIRRAITHGRLLGQTKPFLNEMVFAVRDLMQDAYPELKETAERVAKVVLAEEKQFARTLALGEEKWRVLEEQAWIKRIREIIHEFGQFFDEDISPLLPALIPGRDPLKYTNTVKMLVGESRVDEFKRHLTRSLAERAPTFPGDEAFRLYDTFGLPLDFIQDAVRDVGLAFDQSGFDVAMTEQRTRARASWKGAAKQTANPAYQKLPKSEFEGYLQTRSSNCEVLALLKGQAGGFVKPGNIGDVVSVGELKSGDVGEVILDHTPFYAESGGQVGDLGRFTNSQGNVIADVQTCYAPVQGVRSHLVLAKQSIRVGDKVDAVVNADIREATMRNHTATHLLQAGLREVLGKHVKQAGSLVAPNHLRFDFSHFTGVEDEELQDIEDLINKEVLRNVKVEVIPDVPIDVAVNEYKAMALFGEKYGERVRVIKIGDFSTELCGGTHTEATGEIGLIKILKEGSVSSGVRRIEAVTGEGSLEHFRKDHELGKVVAGFAAPTLSQKTRNGGAAEEVLSPAEALVAELEKKDAEIKRLARELDQVRMKSASSGAAHIEDKIKEVKGVKVLVHRADNLERQQMRTLVDQLRDKVGSGVVVLGSANDGSVSLIVGVTKDLTSRIQAGKVIAPIAQKVGGKGGGRPDLAEAGGKDPGGLDAALGEAYGVVESLL